MGMRFLGLKATPHSAKLTTLSLDRIQKIQTDQPILGQARYIHAAYQFEIIE
jgi:hypothetical protein